MFRVWGLRLEGFGVQDLGVNQIGSLRVVSTQEQELAFITTSSFDFNSHTASECVVFVLAIRWCASASPFATSQTPKQSMMGWFTMPRCLKR